MTIQADTRLAGISGVEAPVITGVGLTTYGGQSGTGGDHKRRRVRELRPTALRRRLQIADFTTLCVGVLVVGALYETFSSMPTELLYQHMLVGLLSVPLWMIGLSVNKLFNSALLSAPRRRSAESPLPQHSAW